MSVKYFFQIFEKFFGFIGFLGAEMLQMLVIEALMSTVEAFLIVVIFYEIFFFPCAQISN